MCLHMSLAALDSKRGFGRAGKEEREMMHRLGVSVYGLYRTVLNWTVKPSAHNRSAPD